MCGLGVPLWAGVRLVWSLEVERNATLEHAAQADSAGGGHLPLKYSKVTSRTPVAAPDADRLDR